jgi:cytochrome c biogenesis protein CcdA
MAVSKLFEYRRGGVAGPVEHFLESILALVANLADSIVDPLPVGYAFGAGMVATVNPCGFALLPAYIAFYLGDNPHGSDRERLPSRLLKSLLISIMVTLGFVLLFGAVGLVISSGGRFIVDAMPWAGLAVGVLMLALGAWLFAGKRSFYLGAATRLSARINVGKGGSIPSYFLFGVAYGIASLSCTLPIFLIVVVSSLTGSSFVSGMTQFVSYSLGMGATLMVLTVGIAVFKGVAATYMRRIVPYVERASAGMVTLAGIFIVYYWLTIGELGESIQGFF